MGISNWKLVFYKLNTEVRSHDLGSILLVRSNSLVQHPFEKDDWWQKGVNTRRWVLLEAAAESLLATDFKILSKMSQSNWLFHILLVLLILPPLLPAFICSFRKIHARTKDSSCLPSFPLKTWTRKLSLKILHHSRLSLYLWWIIYLVLNVLPISIIMITSNWSILMQMTIWIKRIFII